MKSTQLMSLGLVALAAAACGGSTAQLTAKQPPAKASVTAPIKATTGSASSPAPCATRDLSLRLGGAGGAAGSVYEPLIFTNTGAGRCTLDGYPGVSFVASQSGDQVGAPASRNPQHAATSVTLAPGASASAMVQVANAGNYPPSACKPAPVTGLRVYPPGQTAAAYVAFNQPQQACSTNVAQLTVQAVVAGTAGM